MLASRKQRDRDRSNTPRRVVRGHQPVLHPCQKDPNTPGGRAGRADAGFKLGGGFRRGADDSEQWSEAETGGRRNRGTPLDALTIASSITVMEHVKLFSSGFWPSTGPKAPRASLISRMALISCEPETTTYEPINSSL